MNLTQPSKSTSPVAHGDERGRDAAIRAAANLAPTVIPGEIGEQVRILLWSYYNTPNWRMVDSLARSILKEAGVRT